jgi:hypothetical protein
MILPLRGISDKPLDPAAYKSKKSVEYPIRLGEADHADPNDLVP